MSRATQSQKAVAAALRTDCPIVSSALHDLLGLSRDSFSSLLHELSVQQQIDSTETRLTTYYLRRNAGGKVRFADLAVHIANHYVQYAIPRTRLKEALDYAVSTNNYSKLQQLEKEARGLFVSGDKTGEVGEILLYALAESHLQLPQVLCKMSLKTSGEMHFHGADGVHVGVDDSTGVLAVYWGESKLYKSMSEAVGQCMLSIAPVLKSGPGSTSPSSRDVQLLRGHADLGTPGLTDAFKRYLDPADELSNRVVFRGLCLVGFDLANYPNPFDGGESGALTDQISRSMKKWESSIGLRVANNDLEAIHIEALCLPFPSVELFREAFLKEIGH